VKNLIVARYPDQASFCCNGIYKTIIQGLAVEGKEVRSIDLQ